MQHCATALPYSHHTERSQSVAGISDTHQPDDLKQHLELVIEADDERKPKTEDGAPEEEETEEERELRESVMLPQPLRMRAEAALASLQTGAPGLTAAEAEKLMTTESAQAELAGGKDALARVDSHLQSRTGERNPKVATRYGVYGKNPESFPGVLRALELSVTEDAKLRELPAESPERNLIFTPVIRRKVETSRDALARLINQRLGTRAELSQTVSVKNKTLDEAESVLTDIREHLYANLPEGKQDPALRKYGYRPLVRRSTAKDPAEPNPEAPADPDSE